MREDVQLKWTIIFTLILVMIAVVILLCFIGFSPELAAPPIGAGIFAILAVALHSQKLLRLVCAGVVSVIGALLTIQISSTANFTEHDSNFVAILIASIIIAVLGSWGADLLAADAAERAAKARRVEAEESAKTRHAEAEESAKKRHAEMMCALESIGSSTSGRRIGAAIDAVLSRRHGWRWRGAAPCPPVDSPSSTAARLGPPTGGQRDPA